MENPRKKIILADDNKSNLDQGRNILKPFYDVYPAPSAARLFEMLEKIVPDLILLDISMPETDGYEAIKKLKADKRFADIPVIFLTSRNDVDSESEGFDLGAADYILKPFSAPLLIKRIENQLLIVRKTKDLLASQAKLQEYATGLEDMVREKTAEVIELQSSVIATVADLVEFRDKSTGGHIMRTRLYYKALIDSMLQKGIYTDELSVWNIDTVLESVQLHDVGKIGISDLILNKPGKLIPDEFEIMKTHVTVGVDAIERIMKETTESSFLNHALLIAGTHHEKWDGSGYPTGIKGDGIPLEGRMMAIVDVYDALVSNRPYKKAFSHDEACKIIENGAGTHFDPALVEVFRMAKNEFARIINSETQGTTCI